MMTEAVVSLCQKQKAPLFNKRGRRRNRCVSRLSTAHFRQQSNYPRPRMSVNIQRVG